MKILIVDDGLDPVKLIKNSLISLGHEVITSADSIEALQRAHAEMPDLVVTGGANIEALQRLIDAPEGGHPDISAIDTPHPRKPFEKLQSRTHAQHEREESAPVENTLRRLNRMYQTLFESERVLTHSQHDTELLSGICQLLIDVAGYRLAWIGLAEDNPEKTVKPIARAGVESGYLDSIKISWADNEFGQGPTGSAIRSGVPSVVRDIHNDERFLPWRAEAAKRGYSSSIAIPFEYKKIKGALNIYSLEADAFDEKEVELLTRLTDDIAYGLAALWDKEERNRIQEELMMAVRERTHIMETIPDVLYKIDPDGKLLLWNKQAETVSGYSASELLGRDASSFFAEEDRAKVDESIQQAIKSGYSELEADLVTKDGRRIPYHFTGSPILDQEGGLLGLTGIGRDLTDRRKAEDERLQLHKQLKQSQKMELFGQLAGGIAHDFNNILASILGYNQLALNQIDKETDNKLSEYLTEVAKAGERAKSLIAQMLSFSRQTTGDKPYPVNMVALIQDVIKMLQPMLPSSIEIKMQSSASGIQNIVANPTHMQQVIMNLCVNARDAMGGRGQIAVSVDSLKVEQTICSSCHKAVKGEFVAVSVHDCGSGVAPEVLDRIFEPFFTTKEIGKGTGMGLAMVHGIVHEHHGHVVVESEFGKGTTFQLLLPITPSDTETPMRSPEESRELLLGKGRKVLVVDDDEAVVAFIESYLELHDFNVKTFSSSTNALSYFEDHRDEFDLVISDQTMPIMTGVEMAKAMLSIRPGLPIILITGYSEEVDESIAKASGIVEFLMKPFSINELLQAIRNHLA